MIMQQNRFKDVISLVDVETGAVLHIDENNLVRLEELSATRMDEFDTDEVD